MLSLKIYLTFCNHIVCVALNYKSRKKETIFGGIGNFLGHRMQAILEMSQITQTGWHLTPIAITSEQTGVAVGAHLVLTWVGCSTGPAVNPGDTRTKTKATPVSSSVPTGLGVGCYHGRTSVGMTSSGPPEVGTRSLPSSVAPSSLSPLDMQTTTVPGWCR